MNDTGEHNWLKGGSTSSSQLKQIYDDWANNYDDNLKNWDYRAPAHAADMLHGKIQAGSVLLDVGCGTGLSGAALRAAGFTGPIDGVDLSPASLKKAEQRDVYRTLAPVDLQALPLAMPDNCYDAVLCVGVLTYVPESEGVLREFARILRPGGTVLVTQRDDLFQERNFAATLENLAGTFDDIQVSDPLPYLPGNPDFADAINVIYVVLTLPDVGG